MNYLSNHISSNWGLKTLFIEPYSHAAYNFSEITSRFFSKEGNGSKSSLSGHIFACIGLSIPLINTIVFIFLRCFPTKEKVVQDISKQPDVQALSPKELRTTARKQLFNMATSLITEISDYQPPEGVAFFKERASKREEFIATANEVRDQLKALQGRSRGKRGAKITNLIARLEQAVVDRLFLVKIDGDVADHFVGSLYLVHHVSREGLSIYLKRQYEGYVDPVSIEGMDRYLKQCLKKYAGNNYIKTIQQKVEQFAALSPEQKEIFIKNEQKDGEYSNFIQAENKKFARFHKELVNLAALDEEGLSEYRLKMLENKSFIRYLKALIREDISHSEPVDDTLEAKVDRRLEYLKLHVDDDGVIHNDSTLKKVLFFKGSETFPINAQLQHLFCEQIHVLSQAEAANLLCAYYALFFLLVSYTHRSDDSKDVSQENPYRDRARFNQCFQEWARLIYRKRLLAEVAAQPLLRSPDAAHPIDIKALSRGDLIYLLANSQYLQEVKDSSSVMLLELDNYSKRNQKTLTKKQQDDRDALALKCNENFNSLTPEEQDRLISYQDAESNIYINPITLLNDPDKTPVWDLQTPAFIILKRVHPPIAHYYFLKVQKRIVDESAVGGLNIQIMHSLAANLLDPEMFAPKNFSDITECLTTVLL